MGIKILLFTFPAIFLLAENTLSQSGAVEGTVKSGNLPVASASVQIRKTKQAVVADSLGNFSFSYLLPGSYTLLVSSVGFYSMEQTVVIEKSETKHVEIVLTPDGITLNTVVVTGVSKATLIKENPVAISLVSEKQLAQATESNLIDALAKNVMGLTVVKTGPNISKPFIRGLGYNRVLTLYDGMRQEGQQWGDEHGIEADAYHIAKAEVIKGPASLQYGSDAVAGVVSLFPFMPKFDKQKWKGNLTSEYQSNNRMIGNGFRAFSSNNHFLFSVSGSFRLAGNYKNDVDDRVYNTGFSEKNLSVLTGIHTKSGYSHLSATLYDNLQGIPDGSRDSLSRRFTKQVSEGAADNIKNRLVVSGTELNSYHLSPLHQHIQHYRIYSHHSYHTGKGEADALIGFQQNIRREYNHPTLTQQAGMYVRLNTLNYNLRYTLPEWKRIELTAGINGMAQTNRSLHATDFPIPDYRLFDAGVYMYGKWKKERWTISGGIRNDIRAVSWNDFYTKTDLSNGFAYHAKEADTMNGYLQFTACKKRFSGTSASLGFTYRVNDRISFKANIGRGYRAPGITEMASNGLDPGAHIIYLGNKSFEPEFSTQEDAGVSLNDPNVTAEASVFNNNIKHYIYLTLVTDENGNAISDAQGNRTFQYQQAEAQLYGIEAWFSFHPHTLKGVSFDNSIAIVYGFNRKIDYKNTKNKGEYLPLIPPVKVFSTLAKKTEVSAGMITGITTRIELEYNGKQNRFLGLNNTETATPSYVLLNTGLLADIRYVKEKTMQLLLQVNNLANQVYQSHLSRLKYFEYYINSPDKRSGIYSMGRNVCVKMILPF